jgi:hypothetical protein
VGREKERIVNVYGILCGIIVERNVLEKRGTVRKMMCMWK